MEPKTMSKEDLKEFTSWMTAKNWARRKVKKTGKPIVIYYVMEDNARVYKYMPSKMWEIMRPGVCAMVVHMPRPYARSPF